MRNYLSSIVVALVVIGGLVFWIHQESGTVYCDQRYPTIRPGPDWVPDKQAGCWKFEGWPWSDDNPDHALPVKP